MSLRLNLANFAQYCMVIYSSKAFVDESFNSCFELKAIAIYVIYVITYSQLSLTGAPKMRQNEVSIKKL